LLAKPRSAWFYYIMSSKKSAESSAETPPATHSSEPHFAGSAQKLNWLRAGVLGANDGIVSVAALVVGVAGATAGLGNNNALIAASAAGLIGGAISMALGEYVSVSSQRDSERDLIAKERWELEHLPEEELQELADIYASRGLSAETAMQVAVELTAHDALGAHLSAELNIVEDDIASPWHAAFASALAFTIGGLLPVLGILLPPESIRVPVTFIAVLLALAGTGWLSAYIGGGSKRIAIARIVIGGAIALTVTFALGHLLGTAGIAG